MHPLIYTRHKDLIRLHFRLTVSHADSLAASLYKYRLSQTSLSMPQPSYTIEHEILQSIHLVFPSWTSALAAILAQVTLSTLRLRLKFESMSLSIFACFTEIACCRKFTGS